MTRLRMSFRTRISVVLVVVLALAFGLVLVLVQDVTRERVQEDFAGRFARAVAALRQVQRMRADFVERELASLTTGHPQFRTILSTASLAGADLGFGPGPATGGLRDANLRIRSLLPSIPLAFASDVFVVASGEGELLFTKVDPDRFGDDLSTLPVLRRAAAAAGAADAWPGAPEALDGARLVPDGDQGGLYQVWAEPVVFDGDVHGFVIVGDRMDRAFLERLRELTGLDLALSDGTRLVATTLSGEVGGDLADRLLRDPPRDDVGRVRGFQLAEERFLVSAAEVVPGFGADHAALLVLQSLDAELAFLAGLRRTVLLLGGAILLVALGFGFGVARRVTRPLAELGQATRRLGAGDLSTQVRVRTGDELEQLADAFNEMAAGLLDRERIRRTFERFVSKDVAEAVLRRPELAPPSGERRELSVAFFDMGGFTSLAEALPPEDLVERLNAYFEVTCQAVFDEAGTLNQFYGDGVLAFFGAPVPHVDHAQRACRAARRALASLGELSARFEADGLPPLRARVGVHTGECVVGELGALDRRQYGAVGDAVNLASRLEGANKFYGTQVIASEATVSAAGFSLAVRELDWIRVVGRQGTERIFEVLPGDEPSGPADRRMLAAYARGLEDWRKRSFGDARAAFVEALEAVPEDGPSRAFLSRLDDVAGGRLPEDWSPVFEPGEK